ncbi:MAG: glycoside hydrolase family 127 protein [Oscillospiraceae bacterium]|jgi:DUF1680 family protein|nr:glycoside hydrolase family 127 protein [Oscillospiraceae bacterium]
MKSYKKVSFSAVQIEGGFWARRQEINRDVTMFAVRDRFRDTGRFDAFHFLWREEQGNEKRPHIFWDSDIAKWLESVAYVVKKNPATPVAEELEKQLSETVDAILEHQEPCGYFNTYYQLLDPKNHFTNRDHHELYCAGHLMEAAVAWFEATGDRKFLDAMCRYAGYIETVFVNEKRAGYQTPGHEEIELALVKLYHATGEKRYLDLSKHFIDLRGVADEDPLLPWSHRSYNQSHLPVREQTTPEGHAVRACYLYSGMADIAREYADESLFAACKTIFEHMVNRRMYITGGIGSSHVGEAFTVDYDLPNATAYAETCAAISLAMFASRLSLLEPRGIYADIAERALYNGFLSGVSLDGKGFFYENPLEITLAERNRNASVTNAKERFPITQRKEVFDCSCCPPNVTRVIASVADYLYSHDDDMLLVHQYMDSSARFALGGEEIEIVQRTDYPYDGKIDMNIKHASGKTLALRVPGWCKAYSLSGVAASHVADGYLYVPVTQDDCAFSLLLAMEPTLVSAHPNVTANAGRFALQRGPLVYCMESVDNGENLKALRVKRPLRWRMEDDKQLGLPAIVVQGLRVKQSKAEYLYCDGEQELVNQEIKFIPYHAFANRSESDMLVWFLAE